MEPARRTITNSSSTSGGSTYVPPPWQSRGACVDEARVTRASRRRETSALEEENEEDDPVLEEQVPWDELEEIEAIHAAAHAQELARPPRPGSPRVVIPRRQRPIDIDVQLSAALLEQFRHDYVQHFAGPSRSAEVQFQSAQAIQSVAGSSRAGQRLVAVESGEDDMLDIIPVISDVRGSSSPTKLLPDQISSSTNQQKVVPPNPDWAPIVARSEEEGYTEILETALEYAVESHHRIAKDILELRKASGSGIDPWITIAGDTLCSMNRDVVRHLITGNVSRAYRVSEKAFNEARGNRPGSARAKKGGRLFFDMKRFDAQGQKQPCIYLLSLGDGHGNAPLVKQVWRLHSELISYESVARKADLRHFFIDRIYDDEWSLEKNQRGLRKYVDAGENPSRRRAVIRAFCAALLKELRALPYNDDERFHPTFHYVGYALDAGDRQAQHQKTGTASTNWLSSLVLAILNYHFSDLGLEFEMHFHIICLIHEQQQAAIAEMLLAVIGHAYYWTGLGFNIAYAGASVASIEMKKYSQARRGELWEQWGTFHLDKTPYKENLKWDNDCYERQQEAKEKAQSKTRLEQRKKLKEARNALAGAEELGDEPEDLEIKTHIQCLLQKLEEAEQSLEH